MEIISLPSCKKFQSNQKNQKKEKKGRGMPYKSQYSKYMNKLVKWAKKTKHITVVFTTGQADRFMPEDRLVIVDESQSEKNQMFTLLHELGHAMNRDTRMSYKNGKYHLLQKSEATGRPIKSYAYRVQVLDEEMSAWKNGRLLADKLGIKLDEREYENCAAKCVMTYVDWASEREWNAPA